MCGIVGILSSMEPSSLSIEQRKKAVEAALVLQKKSELSDQERDTLLSQIALFTFPLPGFATSYLLGSSSELEQDLRKILDGLDVLEEQVLEGKKHAGGFQELEKWNQVGIRCKDLVWRLKEDVLGVQETLYSLVPKPWSSEQRVYLKNLWEIEFVLRGLNKLEIRGRDSSGLSIQVTFPTAASVQSFSKEVQKRNLWESLVQRTRGEGLSSSLLTALDPEQMGTTFGFLYKVASEVGSIGQNIKDLRSEMQSDELLKLALSVDGSRLNILSHTRWASNGIINVFNAHPQGNDVSGMTSGETKLFASLNGDIDNFSELLESYTRRTGKIAPLGVTTDAKIIPLLVEERYQKKGDLKEAFRECLQEFKGSFAIGIQHADHPDVCYLGIGGSGQSLYVGLSANSVFFASELYGLVEGTYQFVKLDGEKERVAGKPETAGQLVEIRREDIGKERPFSAWSLDGHLLDETHLPFKKAEITTRDINIGKYEHFFLKEISESIQSVDKTLYGRFVLTGNDKDPFQFSLDETTVPEAIVEKINAGKIRRIFCIGQGTAAVAAMGVCHALHLYMGSDLSIQHTKASELSGHMLDENMEDTLAIAVSQSGTTTDTNRTVDLLRQRGASVLAILNRRNSDLHFKADGVVFTSDGRDIEMSVASTKAFYSQVTAGALLSIYLAHRTGRLSPSEVLKGLKELQSLPGKMKSVFQQSEKISEVAKKYGLQKRYWAVVGSGANQIAAHEIRIKLSELCYKSISCDFIEDKKHIDLSAEPLMLVCVAGLDETNLSDSVKEVAIFKAHSSIPIVVASRGADRFLPYAAAVFEVPDVSAHLSPILTTIVGHLFGYYAACAIDDQAKSLRLIRQALLNAFPTFKAGQSLNKNHDLVCRLENLLEIMQENSFDSSLEVHTAVRLVLSTHKLLQSIGDDKSSEKGESPYELAQKFQNILNGSINELSRPIDAIKHQAKTVTVGISRPEPTLQGALGVAFKELQVDTTQVLWKNLSFLMAAAPLIERVNGSVLYRVDGLDFEGKPTTSSRVFKEEATGLAQTLRSRTDQDHTLRGSKWLAIRNNAVQIGVGEQDQRTIAIIPLRGENANSAMILLLHISFNEKANLQQRLNLLRNRGAMYDKFCASVTEINLPWSDDLLLQVPVSTLFSDSTQPFISALPSIPV